VRIAVVDSTPLINLVHLRLALELPRFFDRVYVPRTVQTEVNKKGRFRYRLTKLYATGFFVRCSAANETNVSILRAELDPGEAEALIQAQEKNAAYFIGDDRQARETASNMGQRVVGTVRILARLALEGTVPDVRKLVRDLRRDPNLKFRVSDEVLEEAIAKAGDPI
jgi:uncharacterized protein